MTTRTPLTDEQRLELFLVKGMPFNVNSVAEFDRGAGISNISNQLLLKWVEEILAFFPDDRRLQQESKWIGVIVAIASLPPSFPNSYDFYNKLFINQTGKALFSTDDGGKMRQFTLDCLEILYHLVYEEMRNAD